MCKYVVPIWVIHLRNLPRRTSADVLHLMHADFLHVIAAQ